MGDVLVDVKRFGLVIYYCLRPLNAASNLAERFRALFTLRNINGPAAIDNIARGWSEHGLHHHINARLYRVVVVVVLG